jgi:hypothetical protein
MLHVVVAFDLEVERRRPFSDASGLLLLVVASTIYSTGHSLQRDYLGSYVIHYMNKPKFFQH